MEKEKNNTAPASLARELVLNELFDLTLYKRFLAFAKGDTSVMLSGLVEVETRHAQFWQDFFKIKIEKLDFLRRVKLEFFVRFSRVFGEAGMHLIIEAIEIHGIRNYLHVWDIYKNEPLGEAVRGILNDEFVHEDEIVSLASSRRIHPERVRDIFLGLNDGLVEIVGAASGFFAAFQTTTAVFIAGFTVAIAGSISMAAGAFGAVSSEHEIEDIQKKKKMFLREKIEEEEASSPYVSAAIVGTSYFIGATVPILPVLFGEKSFIYSVLIAMAVAVLISYFLAFLSGMSVAKRITTNIIIIAVAVTITYSIGVFAKGVFGVKI
ncbi:MAG TPA: VIT1/CCC1 transporter family protein [Candidatus Paceibacterota bacterium]|nr:VIT1/CCC1 transporter family protein [Candidatus Paceibacterota bacterium]